MSKFQLNFRGDKEEVKKKLIEYTKHANLIANGYVISLIEDALKNKEYFKQ